MEFIILMFMEYRHQRRADYLVVLIACFYGCYEYFKYPQSLLAIAKLLAYKDHSCEKILS